MLTVDIAERWGTDPTPVDLRSARMFTCLECGALVQGGYSAQLHDRWHAHLDLLAEELGLRPGLDAPVAQADEPDEGPTPGYYPNGYFGRFILRRYTDQTGISGTGDVAWGIRFPDGRCALRWRPGTADTSSTGVYDTIADVERVHGHAGQTRIVWID